MVDQKTASTGEPEFHLSRSAIFPLFGSRATWSQEHLLSIFATIVAGLLLIAAPIPGITFSSNAEINEAWQVYAILALYIAFLVNYYVNQMSGRARPGWLLALVGLFTFLMLGSPFWWSWYQFFYVVVPAAQWQKSPHLAVQLAGWWFGTGLCEEGFKAWPLIGLALLGAALGPLSRRGNGRLSKRLAGLRKRIALCEPLDGIVLGVASGSGFFIAETLLQYVPGAMKGEKYPGSQAFDGLVLLLGRGLPNIAEHSAWCGLFGYFIGLSALQPRMAVFLLPLGWLTAAALHAGWDATPVLTDNGFVILVSWIVIGLSSYALLAGAIFKAREISPRLTLQPAAAPAVHAATAPAPASVPLPAFEVPDGD